MNKSLISFLFLCVLLAPFDAEAFKMPKIGGKGKNPTALLIKALTDIPKQIVEFSKLMAAANANIATVRMASSNSNTPPEQLQAMSMQLDRLINDIQAKIVMFRRMPIIMMLDTLSQQCGSPVMSAAMAAPYIGTAVAGLCGKIATVDLKVDMLLGRAEFLLANALTAKEAMFARMSAAQVGGTYGMPNGALANGGMQNNAIINGSGGLPPGMPSDIKPPSPGGGDNTVHDDSMAAV